MYVALTGFVSFRVSRSCNTQRKRKTVCAPAGKKAGVPHHEFSAAAYARE
ncbi:hypothetical protein CFter6_1822 [Collimonas fungivorans]|uniref:Uncharacterized protein n=1 Tax=Collimonas fungivorans TaxID=158899 RepID=A0A127P9M9_9BURK|nr:hypothetical protein CFter6_1822 [Collimonas fungivorans]